jgi:hypothetical protein
MNRTLKIATAFAGVGLLVPWIFLAYDLLARRMGRHPDATLLLYLCPSSILALGLDNASLLMGLAGWLIISLSNALLYGMIGVAIGFVIFSRRRR